MRNRDLGLSGVLAVLGAAFSLLFGLAAHTAGPTTVAAFGPEKFVRGTGAPQRFDRSFALSPGADGRCTLAVQNGDGDKTRVTGATLTLNGAVAVGPSEFLKPVPRIEKAVALKPQNALTVYLASKPGSFLVVSVACPATGTGNTPPAANAGPDQTVSAKSTVQLDGTASRDADGDPLIYRWTLTGKPFGSRAALNDSKAAKPTFVADLPGEYVAQLVVNDGKADSIPDAVKIKVNPTANTPPVADAGPDQTAQVGATVTLDGSASRDPDGDALAYGWLLVKRPLGSRAYLKSWLTAKPTFVADKAGEYVAQLVVFDGRAFSAPDKVSIVAGTVVNTPPVADAGPDQTSEVGKTVHLDGSGSSDADGDALTYAWSFVSRPTGSAATLSDPAAVDPAFTVDKAGSYTVRLIVNDGKAASAPDSVTVSTLNSAPVADAGPDQTAKVGAAVHLDGSGSTDVDGDALTYAWTLPIRPAGSAATLSDPTAVDPAFTVDKAGAYEARLIVNDGAVASAPDGVTVTTENSPPVATAGPDQTATVGATVRLNGTGSTDVDGDALTYQWSLTDVPAGSAATLSEPNAPETVLVADRPGRYVAQLIVHDGKVASEPDAVAIDTENSRPVAEAGSDQTVALNGVARLSGAGSSDADGDPLTYRWSLTGVPADSAATLSDPTAVDPSFVADKAGRYAAQLIVNDGALDSEPDTVAVSTENSKPVADAGPDQPAEVGKPATLDGSRSSDADGDPLTYRWSLVARPDGSAASLSVTDPIKPTFVPDLVGEYVAQLIVNDGQLDSDPDTAAVTATDPAPTNRAPTITSTAIEQATVGQPYSYQVVATDSDAGDVLTYSLSTKPDGMTVDAATGLIGWTPATAGGANVVVRATDRGGLFAEQSFAVTVAAATANRSPEVSAVANPATVTLPTNSVALNGTVTDDGLPDPPGAVTVTWSKDASSTGTGTVTFGDAGKEDTTATFSTAGTYVLRLTASDGALTGAGEVTITVAPAANQAPQVSVSANPQTITLPANSVALSSTVTDDGLPDPPAQVTLAWSQDSGPGAVTFGDAGQANTTATFPAAGTYVLRLTANDGDQSASATVTVTAASQGTTQERLLPLGSYPAGVTLGDTKDVIFTVSLVGAPGVVPTEVTLQALDDTGTVVVNHLGSLHDDGLNGDLGAGDFIYSGIFTIAGEHEGKLLYRAKAEIPGVGEVVSENYAFVVTPFPVGFKPYDPDQIIAVPSSELQGRVAKAVAATSSSEQQRWVVGNELLVLFKADVTPAEINAAAASVNGIVVGYSPYVDAYQVRLGDGTLDGWIKAYRILSGNSNVIYVAANAISEALNSPHLPDDPKLNDQWGVAKVRADEAWLLAAWLLAEGKMPKKNNSIAILDTGIDLVHPDLAGNGKIIRGHDYIDGDDFPSDKRGHGTHVAGIVAAHFSNKEGISGISWNSDILAIRTQNEKGGGSVADMIQGIGEAASKGAKVINMSFGFSLGLSQLEPQQLDLDLLQRAVKRAHEKGSLLVAAAGNENSGVPIFPAGLDFVMAIGSTDKSDKKSAFSNYGNWIDMSAPGENIISTFPTDFHAWLNPLNCAFLNYCSMSGTSMAAPFVSGAAAVLWSFYPNWTPDQIVERLKKTAKPLPGQQLGAGRLDLFNAIFDGSFELSNYLVGWSLPGGGNSSIQKSWRSLSPTDGAQFALVQQDSDFAEKMARGELFIPSLSLSFYVKPETKSLPISFDYNFSLVNVKSHQLEYDSLPRYGYFSIRINGPNGVADPCVQLFLADQNKIPFQKLTCDDKPFEAFELGKWRKVAVNIDTAGSPGLYSIVVSCMGNTAAEFISAEACAFALDNVQLGEQ